MQMKGNGHSEYVRVEERANVGVTYFKDHSYNVEAYSRFIGEKQQGSSIDYFSKSDRIVEELLSKHAQAKGRLERIKIEQRKQEEKIIGNMKFKPSLNKSRRYPIYNNLEERGRSWTEERNKRFASQTEEKAKKEFKDCTFSPALKAKKQSMRILERKKQRENIKRKSMKNVSQEADERFAKIKTQNSFKGTKLSGKEISLDFIKRIIKKQLIKIPL